MSVYEEVKSAVRELAQIDRPDFRPVRLLVAGGSSSEINGGVIGHFSRPETGVEAARAVLDCAREFGFDCCFQCCEHLNRALVMERRVAERCGYETVCAVPYPKAGGSLASAAYRMMDDPVLVERVSADAGIDMGQTLIGMHLRPVAVPVRLSVTRVGEAVLTCARTRGRLIGGERARYSLDESHTGKE